MYSVELSVLQTLHDWLPANQQLWLVTVVETFSGGCIEDDLLLRMQSGLLLTNHCEILSDGIGKPGTPPIAAAAANALFTLTSKCLRRMPFDQESLA